MAWLDSFRSGTASPPSGSSVDSDAAKEPPHNSTADAVRFGAAHDALQKAEKGLRNASEEREACETRLAKLVATEAKAREALRAAREELNAALERRKPEADSLVGPTAASISFGTLVLNGQEVGVDTEGDKVVAAMAALRASAAVKLVAKATPIAADELREDGRLRQDFSVGQGMGIDGGQPASEPSPKRKAEEAALPLDAAGGGAGGMGGNLEEQLKGVCAKVAATVVGHGLQHRPGIA